MANAPSWRDDTAAKKLSGPPRQTQIFKVLFAMCALIGVILGLVYLIQPAKQPYFVPICITEYKDRRMPVNAQAEQDRVALLEGTYFSNSRSAFASQELHKIRDELKDLENRKSGEIVVLYLSAHLLPDEQGKLNLVPGNASVDDLSARVSLKDILLALKNCPSRQKLLVLDTFRPIADPRLGVLANDMASRVPEELEDVPDEGRLVLCACSPGQTSLTSEDLQRSVFGYYFEEGLRGWADGYNPDYRLDGRVTVQEMQRFLTSRMDRWAALNRKAKQSPILYGDGNFDLVVVSGGKPQPMPGPPDEITEYPPWLRAAWQLRDQWWEEQVYRTAPRLFRILEANVLWAEQHWRGGGDAGQIQANLDTQIKQLKEQESKARRSIPRPEPRSLALAVALGKKPDPEVRPAFDSLLITLENIDIQVKPEERANARREELQKFREKIKDKTPFDLAFAVFESIAQDANPRWEKINTLQETLKINQRLPLFVETLHLRRLEELGNQVPPKEWSNEFIGVVRRSLLATREGEKALACLALTGWEPRALRWLSGAIESAAQKRHDAEVILFSPGYASPTRASQLFDEAIVEYKMINEQLESFQRAFRIRDEALAQLPALAPWLMAQADSSGAWRDAVDNLLQLQAALDEPHPFRHVHDAELGMIMPDVRRREEDLRNAMSQLLRPLRADLPALIAKTEMIEYDPAILGEIDAVLQTTCMSAKDRERLWSAQRRLARGIIEQTRQIDAADPEKQRQAPSPPQFDVPRANQQEWERSARRARMALDLLLIGKLPGHDVSILEGFLPVKTETLPALSNETRLSWASRLPKALADSPDLPTQDRMARIMHPFDGSALLDDEIKNPSVTLLRDRTLALWRFMGDRYHYERLDLTGLNDPQDTSPVSFRQWADEYMRDQLEPYRPWSLAYLATSDTPNLRDRKTAAYPLSIQSEGPTPPMLKSIGVELADDDWLRVTIPPVEWEKASPWEVPLEIGLKSGATMSNAGVPKGFLAQTRVGARSFHARVPVLLPQPDAQRLQLILSDNPNDGSVPVGNLRLRPNTKQQLWVFVKNPTEQVKKVVVELKTDRGTTTSDVVEIPPRDEKRVNLAKGGGAAPGGQPNELPELSGTMVVQLRDADNRRLVHDQKTIDVEIASPQDYIQVTRSQYVPEKRQLIVNLKATPALVGPPCRVQLVLPPERINGFIKAGSGTFEGILNKPGDELNLVAEELQFDESRSDENGYFYLTVDGYERAFIFFVTFARQSATTIAARDVHQTAIRLQSGRWARADENFRTGVEVDNAPRDVRLVVDFQRTKGGEFRREMEVQGGRKQRVGFTPAGPDGSLQFETEVTDWPIVLNTRGVIGERQLRVRMLNRDGRELLADTKTIMLDDTGPIDSRIVGVDGKAPRQDPPLSVESASSVVVKAEAKDPESGIKEVLFFVGKPVEGKIPPTAKVERGTANDARTNWTCRLGLPAQKGEIEITAQFVNGVGMSIFETIRLNLTEPKGPPPPDKDGKIRGIVVSGDRKQPNVSVLLLDEQNKEKMRTTTNEEGSFQFDKVPPGTYKVRAVKASSREGGTEATNVEAGKTSEVKISIFRE